VTYFYIGVTLRICEAAYHESAKSKARVYTH